MVRWVVRSILHGVDPLSYFSFQPVLHDWCNKGCGMFIQSQKGCDVLTFKGGFNFWNIFLIPSHYLFYKPFIYCHLKVDLTFGIYF